jgi:polyferredoxin
VSFFVLGAILQKKKKKKKKKKNKKKKKKKKKKPPNKIIRLTFKLSIVLGFVGITTEDSNQKRW